MNKHQFPRLAALATALFDKPVSQQYLVLSVLLIFAGTGIVYSDSKLPETARHVIMVGTMVGIARLFKPMPMRWVWAGIVGLTAWCSCSTWRATWGNGERCLPLYQ